MDDALPPPRLLYDIPHAAEQLSLGESTLERLVRDGEIESVKVGRRRLVPHDGLVDFVERTRRDA